MTGHSAHTASDIGSAGENFVEAFAEYLVRNRKIDTNAAERSKRAAEATGDRFDQVLTKLGLLPEEDLTASLAHFLGLPTYAPRKLPPKPLLPDKIPPRFVKQNGVVPIDLRDGTLTLAVVDPLDRAPIESLRFVVDHKLRLEVIAPAEFRRILSELYLDQESQPGAKIGEKPDGADEQDLQKLRDSASEAPVVRLVNQIIAEAVEARASDIYIEPAASALLVRYRVDGALRVAHEVPIQLQAAVSSRIKILARLDIAERRLPQDGRVKLPVRGNDIDFRIATIPTINGEAVTIRVLDRSRVSLNFESLGFDESQTSSLRKMTEYPNGIILVTGPTGSGKTTTLYTMLKHVNSLSTKIFTVEDPIEYQLTGISQVQVHEGINLSFPACLRSILRHHPDMIMIGEIRDVETARIAVQASLTGHLVFSTLHTNSAAETVTRLIDMGVEHFLVGSTLRGIVAQRLVRRLCQSCASPHESSAAWSDHLLQHLPELRHEAPGRLLQARGCDKCHGAGFQGQMCIAEIMQVDEDVRQAIFQRKSGSEIEAAARSRGTISMYADGVTKAWKGLTTLEEVFRVANNL